MNKVIVLMINERGDTAIESGGFDLRSGGDLQQVFSILQSAANHLANQLVDIRAREIAATIAAQTESEGADGVD